MRQEFRTAMLGYVFDYSTKDSANDEDMSFEGFQKQSMSMLDELDAFQLG